LQLLCEEFGETQPKNSVLKSLTLAFRELISDETSPNLLYVDCEYERTDLLELDSRSNIEAAFCASSVTV
jgi:hypothetical protein